MINLKAVKAMHETMAFDRAIERALELINFEETLVIVTADHSHVMTMAGYPSRGTDIRGILKKAFEADPIKLFFLVFRFLLLSLCVCYI